MVSIEHQYIDTYHLLKGKVYSGHWDHTVVALKALKDQSNYPSLQTEVDTLKYICDVLFNQMQELKASKRDSTLWSVHP